MTQSRKTNNEYIFRFEVETILRLLQDVPYLGRGLRDEDDEIRFRSIPDYDYAIYYSVNDDMLEILTSAFIPERASERTIANILNPRLAEVARNKD